jgi:hypothetical protein
MLQAIQLFYMNGKILNDELDGTPFYLSLSQGRRYYPNALDFAGSDEEFRKACTDCPPDIRDSYAKDFQNIWKPTWCQRYQNDGAFREEVKRIVAEKCRSEDLACKFEKEIA